MRGDKPVLWHQGLFLQPQHFQLAERVAHQEIEAIRKLTHPFMFGAASFEIREEGLETGRFELSTGEFIFPGGHYCKLGENAVIRPRDFDKHWQNREAPFTVYIGLRQWNPSAPNVSEVNEEDALAGTKTMFASYIDPESCPDLHCGGPDANVRRMHYVLRIFFEDELENIDSYHIFKLARLERDGATIRLSDSFVPPLVSTAASPWLQGVLRDIRDQIASRCRRLERYKSPHGQHNGELDMGVFGLVLALRSLNRCVPVLQHIVEAPNAHPWDVYGQLRQILGELSTFAEGISAVSDNDSGTRSLPPYTHDDLFNCFNQASELLSEILRGINVGPELVTKFEKGELYLTTEVPEKVFAEGNRFWLLVQTTANEDTVIEDFHNIAKLTATKGMSLLLARSVPGIPVEISDQVPQGLPKQRDTIYFRINTDSSQWESVAQSGSISLYWDTAPEDTVVLLAVTRG